MDSTTPRAASPRSLPWPLLYALLTTATLLIHGYHPLAEDGGLYLAGVEWKLDPTLFPHYTDFVREHLRFSLFGPMLTALVHGTHLSLFWVLFLVNVLSIALAFYAARQLLRRILANEVAQLAGLALLAAWWTIPVAGTSLMLMDPYITARSLTFPLSLLAIACALDDWKAQRTSLYLCAASIALATLCHPLMAAQAFGLVLILRIMRLRRPMLGLVILTTAIIAICITLQHCAAPETPAIRTAEISRDYWYLYRWHWYEYLGLIGPLATIALCGRFIRTQTLNAADLITRASVVSGSLAVLIASLFAREDLATHLIARLQPLRAYVLIYAILALVLGAMLQQAALHATTRTPPFRYIIPALPSVLILTAAAIFYSNARDNFRTSPQIELPWRMDANPNPWVRAFLWVRANTPRDALFALDAKYINTKGEDAQTFRATALRSAIPDYSKDGGEASITPSLADAWLRASAADKDLSQLDDATRDARLAPFSVTWMVLHANDATTHSCPYDNGVVKVCRLTP